MGNRAVGSSVIGIGPGWYRTRKAEESHADSGISLLRHVEMKSTSSWRPKPEGWRRMAIRFGASYLVSDQESRRIEPFDSRISVVRHVKMNSTLSWRQTPRGWAGWSSCWYLDTWCGYQPSTKPPMLGSKIQRKAPPPMPGYLLPLTSAPSDLYPVGSRCDVMPWRMPSPYF